MPVPPDASDTVRLLHRRRGWAWAGIASLLGFIVFGIASGEAFSGGTAADVSAAVDVVLLVVGVSGLIIAIAETIRLRRLEPSVRATALDHALHYPVHAHPFRYPPKHRASWFFTLLVFAVWILCAVLLLPGQVNGIAYLADPGHKTTFTPVSYSQACGRGGCQTVTSGTLSNGTSVTWPRQVPLGQPFAVRAPVWSWGAGRHLVDDAVNAVAYTITGLLFEAAAVAGIWGCTGMVRQMLLRRRQQAAPAAQG